MEVALYHPEHGYYTRRHDPFGRAGDFYTAEQIQPAYGILMAELAAELRDELRFREFRVVELGAGRAEMAEAFAPYSYLPVETGRGELPRRLTGLIFANEFFDALPVHVARYRSGAWREMSVTAEEDALAWIEGPPVTEEVRSYLNLYAASPVEGFTAEVNLDALAWLNRVWQSLERGYLLAIDYGYTRPESVRFPQGTLMSYRQHAASEQVLRDPGEQDITAHVNFTALEQHAAALGFKTVRFETLGRTLLRVGERDGFQAVLSAESPEDAVRRRLQLKHLLFGMGETFRTLLLKKEGLT